MMNILFFTFITVVIYKLTKLVTKKWTFPLFHPLIICPILLIILLNRLHISANSYVDASKLLTHMLGPATVAFAIPIYKNFHLVKKYIGNIITSVTVGSLAAIASSLALSILFHINPDFIISILPRSITTPIAIEVSKEIGGIPTLTTIFVIITGISGGIMGPTVMKRLSIKSPIARGLALGMSAHGVGTSKAMEYGEQEATFSTLAMIFAAWITLACASFLIPPLMDFAHM
ncbi:LrgB family protein [Neobacillus sp. D3-1R]|uniref:LrgB family protein n=1 Tax=Neobacillus sp. D3-1R TaxID=3445778 RepID=UPI003F9F4D6C